MKNFILALVVASLVFAAPQFSPGADKKIKEETLTITLGWNLRRWTPMPPVLP